MDMCLICVLFSCSSIYFAGVACSVHFAWLGHAVLLLSWPRSDGQKTLEFQGQRGVMILCTARNCKLANCWENCWEKPICQCTGDAHDGLLLWSITFYYYAFIFHIIVMRKIETEFLQTGSNRQVLCFSHRLATIFCQAFEDAGSAVTFQAGAKGRDSIRASHPMMYHVVSPQKKTHQSMCYHLFSILKKHNYFGFSYVIIY